jgi:hypothetical protein
MISPYHTLLTPLIALSPLIHVPLCNMGELGAVCDCVCSVFLVSFDCVWHVGGLVTLQASRTPISRVGVLRPPTRAPRHRPTATQRTRAGLHYRPVAAMDGPNTEQLTVTKSFRVYSIYTHQRRHNY